MQRSILKLSLMPVFIIVFLFACNNQEHAEDKEKDHKNHQTKAEDDYLLPGLNHGLMQSPINILSATAKTGDKHNITLNFTGEINKVENLGHTIQLDFEPGSTITVDNENYTFKQLHFHTPSEHLVDGITYPMEVHIVNIKLDENGEELAEYLVIAFLFKMGKENKFIKKFIDMVPEGDHETREIQLSAIDNSELLKHSVDGLVREYYQYKGSLTTPPYTETVFWLVHKKIFEASPEQIFRINKLEGDNARHIQGVFDRELSTGD
jgi:carbonic anhydrase